MPTRSVKVANAAAVLLITACGGSSQPTSRQATPATTQPTVAAVASAVETSTSTVATASATAAVTAEPTIEPTVLPTTEPTAEPTAEPTEVATVEVVPTVATGEPEGTAESDSMYSSRKSGVRFAVPTDWELDLLVETGTDPYDQVGLRSPDREALILVQVYRLNQTIGKENLPTFKEELDGVFGTLAARNGGEILRSAVYNGGALPGYEYRLSLGNGEIIRIVSLVQGDRQYNIQLEGDRRIQREYAGEYRTVLESFRAPSDEDLAEQPEETTNASTRRGRYESRDGVMSFDYPRGWRILSALAGSERGEEEIKLRDPNDAAGIVVATNRLARSIEDPYSPALRRELESVLSEVAEARGGELLSTQRFQRGALRGFKFRLSYQYQGKQYTSRRFHWVLDNVQYNMRLDADAAGQRTYAPALDRLLRSFKAGEGAPAQDS